MKKDIKKTVQNLKNNQKGSMLLGALLIMGILMIITLGLSDLIIREIRLQADVVTSGQAYYAAESGIEKALYRVHQGAPGVSTNLEHDFDEAGYRVKINGRAEQIPFLDPDKIDLDTVPEKDKFAPLAINESVTIPLFVEENGKRKKLENFYIAYFMNPFDLNLKAKPGAGSLILDDFDVLRWKIFGLRSNVQPYRTESVSDFISVGEDNTADLPRCFGAKIDSNVCKSNVNPNPAAATNVSGLDLPAVCSMTQARVFYEYDLQGGLNDQKQCYDIGNFLKDHEFNYLTLTNAANPLMIKNNKQGNPDEVLSIADREKLATIFYKVVALDGEELPLNEVSILSQGKADGITQDIQVNVAREQFLPVFNFSLYQAEGK